MNSAQNRVVLPNHNAGSIWGIYPMTLLQVISQDSNSCAVTPNSASAVPPLQTGIARKRITGWCAISPQYHTMIPKYFLPIWSLPPSHKSVKGEDLHTVCQRQCNGRAYMPLYPCSVLSCPTFMYHLDTCVYETKVWHTNNPWSLPYTWGCPWSSPWQSGGRSRPCWAHPRSCHAVTPVPALEPEILEVKITIVQLMVVRWIRVLPTLVSGGRAQPPLRKFYHHSALKTAFFTTT